LEEFLPFFMQSDIFMDRAVKISVGGLSPTINWRDIAKEEFALPSLQEQWRLAKVLQKIQSSLFACQCAYEMALNVRVRLCMDLGRRAESATGAASATIESAFECLDSQRVPLNETQRSANCGDVPYYGATGQVDTVGDYIFDEPLILVAEDGGPFNEFDKKAVAYSIEGKSWVNNHAHVLRPRNGGQAIWLLMNLVHRDLRRYTTGSTRGKLNKKQLMQVPLWMPKSETIKRYESTFIHLNVALDKLRHRINSFQKLSTMVASASLGEACA